MRIFILFFTLGCFTALGAESSALEMARAAVAKAELMQGAESREAAACLNALALQHELLQQYKEAEALYRRALAIREKALGKEHLEVAESMANLVDLLRQTGRPKEAADLCRSLLPLKQKIHGDASLEAASCLGCLADILAELDERKAAVETYCELLKIHETLAAAPQRSVSQKLENPTDFRELTNLDGRQQPLFRCALQTHEEVLGHEHTDLGVCYSLMSHMLSYGGGNKNVQEELLRRALEIRTSTLGADHPLTAQIEYRIALLLRRHDTVARGEESLPFLRHSLAVMEKSAGKDASCTFACRQDLAGMLVLKQHYEEALPLKRQILAQIEARGQEDRELCNALRGLADTLFGTRRWQEAAEIYRRRLAVAEKCYKPEDSDYSLVLYGTAHHFEYMDRWQEALPLWRRKLAINEKISGPESAAIAVPLRDLCRCLLKLGELTEAEQLSRRSLKIAEAKNYDVGSAQRQLGEVLHAQRNPQEAAETYERAVESLTKSFGADDWLTKDTLKRYEEVREKMKPKPQAAPPPQAPEMPR